MEKLNSDAQINILRNLKGEEIINTCKVSKKMEKICTSERYDPLWKLKILEEFNVKYNGKNAFKKYEELGSLYDQYIYVLSITENV